MAAGCVMGPGGRVAQEWELVGPFRALAPLKARPAGLTGAETQREPAASEDRAIPSSHPAADGEGEPPGEPKDAAQQEARPPGEPKDVARQEPRPRNEPRPPEASTHGLFSLEGTKLDLGTTAEEPEPVGPAIDPSQHSLFAPVTGVEDTFWYLDLGFRMGVTRLNRTEHQLDRRVNDLLVLDVFGVFGDVTTPLDRKSDLALTTGYIGIGRRETEWLTWNFYLGSGVGGDRDHQRWLNSNLEVNFDYALYYTGMTVDIYPWGLAKRGRYVGFKEHLKAGRPYLVTGIEIGYLRARGWGHFAFAPITLYRDSQYIEDWLFSYLVGMGWEVPINEWWAFSLSVHYTFHFYRPEEYNGWNITYALRYRF